MLKPTINKDVDLHSKFKGPKIFNMLSKLVDPRPVEAWWAKLKEARPLG